MAIRKRKSRASLTRRRKGTKSNSQSKLMKQLQIAKRAEKAALKKVALLTRQHQLKIEKLRKQVKSTIAQKTKQAARTRQQLSNKHSAQIRKLRKEHQSALKKAKGGHSTHRRKHHMSQMGKIKGVIKRRLSALTSSGSRRRKRTRTKARRAA